MSLSFCVSVESTSRPSSDVAQLIASGASDQKGDLIRRGEITPFDTIIANELQVSKLLFEVYNNGIQHKGKLKLENCWQTNEKI